MLLQLISTAAIATLTAICFTLGNRTKTHLFVTVGQDVFKWLSITLVCILITRLLLLTQLMTNQTSRNINSVVFLLAVAGILGSVIRHGHRTYK